jgi:hypothetical protein
MVTYDARPSAFTQLSTTGEWEYLHSAIGGESAIDGSVGSSMAPSLDTGGRNAVIADGIAVIKGQLWRCDAPVSTAIPAASAQNRIDRLVLRLTRGATTSPTVVAPTIITGTPSGSPVIPPITQTPAGIWDIPVSHWTSTSAGGLTGLIDDRRMTNDVWHDMRPLINSFVGTNSGYLPPQYRFSDDLAFVEVAGFVASPPTTGGYNSTPFATLPPAYRPNNASSAQTYKWNATGVADGVATPVVGILPSGSMMFNFLPTSLAQTVIGIFGRYPLDDTNGMIQS